MTVYALGVLLGKLGWPSHNYWWNAADTAACDWSRIKFADSELLGVFSSGDANHLIGGYEVDLPTCPQCCVMMDLALEIRARQLAEAQTQQ